MKKWLVMITMAVSCSLTQGFAQIKDGVYLSGGYSNVVISTQKNQQRFLMNVVAANGHMCMDVEGNIQGNKGIVTDEYDSIPCELSLKADGNILSVETKNEACSAHCGARASLSGEYRIPPKTCEAKSITQQRNQFKKAYDQKQYEKAEDILNRVLLQCDFYMNFDQKDSIRNDLALALYHQGKADVCLEVLKDTVALDENTYLSGDEQLSYAKIEKGILFNYGLCKKKLQ